ncbi:MAG: hypothetical protein MI923_29765 [Phycisphaerales bacterium]|nr:hypothetical protein [Phycisphaerales bacterium]
MCKKSTRVLCCLVAGSALFLMSAADALAGGNEGTVCPTGSGPNVIVGDLTGPSNYSSVGGMDAFSIGTTSCNIGTQNLDWVSSTPDHPVIAQNIFRLKDGRFEQIGVGWLKHGFTALTQNLCGCGCNGAGGSTLGVGCSDPYTSSRNGFQGWPSGGLGPRFQVNAHTGAFDYPYMFRGQTGNSIYKRVQVKASDMDPAMDGGGIYFAEAQYISPDDAAANNGNDNASYRRIPSITGSGNSWSAASFSPAFPTQRGKPAIRAWQDEDPSVFIRELQLTGEGLFLLGVKTTDLGNGFWHYEYAIQNLNSNLSARSFRIPLPVGATIQNIGFHDVDYHSGDGFGSTAGTPVTFDGTDWAVNLESNAITWSTDTFAQNPNANALRWGTLYNFRFDADRVPAQVQGLFTLQMFKPGSPAQISAQIIVPGAAAPVQCTSGDMTDNDVVDGEDIALFTSLLVNGGPTPVEVCAGDLENTPDGSIDMDDVPNFISCVLQAGCP